MAQSVYETADLLLRKSDPASVDAALSLLKKETEARPHDAKAWFELAGGYDFLGRESEALPHYEKTLSLGLDKLSEEDRPRLFIQMGSTLRNLKRYGQARKLLIDGIAQFPKVAALKAFLGLTEYSEGNYRKAAKLFLDSTIAGAVDSSMRDYSRALKYYFEQIDVFPARQRNWMRLYLADCTHPEDRHDATLVKLEHAATLGHLMDVAYLGSIDHEGETPEQCVEEMKNTITGKYGPLIESASFACLNGEVATSASLVTLWKEQPLLAFSMTDPKYRGQRRAGFLIQKSAFALKAAGYKMLYLVVTEGNTPAEKLYRKLGFEFLGPAIPGQGPPQ